MERLIEPARKNVIEDAASLGITGRGSRNDQWPCDGGVDEAMAKRKLDGELVTCEQFVHEPCVVGPFDGLVV